MILSGQIKNDENDINFYFWRISNVSVHLDLAIKTQVLTEDFIMLFGNFIFHVMFTHFVVQAVLEKLHEKRLIWLELFRDTQCAVHLHVRKLDRYLENNDSFTFMEKNNLSYR